MIDLMRERYIKEALPYIPRLLQLIDRNPYSPTYGCFDRSYWHYRTMDFPCGMYQEFVLPLTLCFINNYPGNRFYQKERLRELSIAAIRYANKGSHKDGTCDDYFPFERAMGALVFSLYACSESYLLLGLDDPEIVAFFKRRGDHLAKKNETGRLSNHQALAALALYNVYLITGEEKYRRYSDDRVELTLSWQNKEEGWFQEYEGADPGYHTCTIDFLAKLYKKQQDKSLIGPLKKAVDFAWYFMHPDGSYGGEYGSRNTYHFYPHGFEVMAPFTEKASQIADHFLRNLPRDKRYHNDDDRMTAHYVYNWLQAYEDYYQERPVNINTRENFLKWFPHAKIGICKTDNYYAVVNMAKGGVIKVFSEDGPMNSDTGLIGELNKGTVLITHLMDAKHIVSADLDKSEFKVNGNFSKRTVKLPTPFKQIIFRLLLLTIGRFNANVVRGVLQKILITGKARTKYKFQRIIHFKEKNVEIEDKLLGDIPDFKKLSIGSDATSIYVANSNVYQESVLCEWKHANKEQMNKLKEGKSWVRLIGING